MFNIEERIEELKNEAWEILNQAEAEGRTNLTNSEVEKLEEIYPELKALKVLILAGDDTQSVARVGSRRLTDHDEAVFNNSGGAMTVPSGSRITGVSSRGGNGFRSFGEFATSVFNSGLPGQRPDARLLRNAPTTISTEGVGADGGYAVPPDYRAKIMQAMMGEANLLSYCDQYTTPSNTIEVPADETSPWEDSEGILAYWESEAGQKTQSKLALKLKTLRLNKLIALIPCSDELLDDAIGLDAYLNKKVPIKFTAKINTALIQGTGAGTPQGILNCPSLVSVPKESGQSADTIVFENIVNMWARLYGPCQANSIWLINQDIFPQLFTMSWEGSSSSIPAYMPANGLPTGGLAASPYGTLMGRPVIPVQACPALGDKGDILLVDLKQYFAGMKVEGIKEDISIHLWFDYDVTAFRFVFRIGGRCWWASSITPENSTNNLSWFISLDARA